MVGDARRHCWGHSHRFVNSAEIVPYDAGMTEVPMRQEKLHAEYIMPSGEFGPTGPVIVRTICRYDFEPEGAVILSSTGPVSTEDALDTIEALIKMKREELKRKRSVSNPGDERE